MEARPLRRASFCFYYTPQRLERQALPPKKKHRANKKNEDPWIFVLFMERPTRLRTRYLHLGKVALYQMS